MTAIHVDGKVFVPEEPVNFPAGTPLYLHFGNQRPTTGRDLLESGFVGLWSACGRIGPTLVVPSSTLANRAVKRKALEGTVSDPDRFRRRR